MSIVGHFPGLNNSRRLRRSPVNPLDKSTIVSIYPRAIDEIKETIFPGVFHIPAGSYENPSLTVVGPSSWWKDVGDEQPLLEIPVHSVQIADSVISDYTKGLMGISGNAKPGVFFVLGEITKEGLYKDHKKALESALEQQKIWFKELVRIADILWARTNGNPLAINDDARLAAEYLNLKDKPWLQDFRTVELTNCKACGNLVNPLYPVCSNCKAIVNEARAKELGIKFAAA